ncbi:hypothetical protein JCM5350_001758 [Sporobolomyces pararoseus]
MDSQRIRPSLADLTTLDLDAPAFTEWEINNQQPSVSISRSKPPKIVSTSIPPPVPEIQFDQPTAASTSTSALPTPPPLPSSKPKSRFALQREKQAASQGTERFELNLEEDDNNDSTGGGGRGGALPKASTPKFSTVVKDVLEKPILNHRGAPKPPIAPTLKTHGFPPIRKGVFQQQRKQPISTTTAIPSSMTTTPNSYEADEYQQGGGSVEGLLRSVSKENENVLKSMTESQILEEQRQIREEMGLSEGMIRMLQQRAQQKNEHVEKIIPRSRPPPPPSAPTPQRGIPTPSVHDEDDEEGTPEYIRKHFFPNEPVNPALDWMKPPPPAAPSSSSSTNSPSPSTFTFDLHGNLVSKSASVEQEGGGGDHHVSSSTNFTIPSLLSLTSSSVPSQRSTAYLVLLRIISHPSDHSLSIGSKDWNQLRLQLLEKASWSLRDPTRGVIISSIDLLHYLFSSELDSPSSTRSRFLPNQEIPKSFLQKFIQTDPFLAISLQFSIKSSTLPRSSLNQLLEIVSIYVQLAQKEEEQGEQVFLDLLFSTTTTSPSLLESISERFIAVPWPPATTSTSTSSSELDLIPSPLALELFKNLTISSRKNAQKLSSDHSFLKKLVVESTMRYLAIPPWELSSTSKQDQKLGYEMFEKVFEFWQSLGRYGLGCELRSLSNTLFEGTQGGEEGGIFEKVLEICQAEEGAEDSLVWIEKLLGLLNVWLVNAIDPHVCQHGILWSQVENWNELGLKIYDYSSSTNRIGLVEKSLELLGNWLGGSKVNKSWRGEKEREWIRDRFEKEFNTEGKGRELVETAMRELTATAGERDDNKTRMVTSAIRLSQVYKEDSNPPTPELFSIDSELSKSLIDSTLSSSSPNSDPSTESIELVLTLLPLISDDVSYRIKSTVLVLPYLSTCQAVQAKDSISYLLSTLSSQPLSSFNLNLDLDPSLELPSLIDLPLLNPFYLHSIVVSSKGKVISPLFPTPRDLKLTHSLLQVQVQLQEGSENNKFLLGRDWPLTAVLDELLRSNTSPVLNGNGSGSLLPKGWDASESQLVKSCLVLMRIVSKIYYYFDSHAENGIKRKVENSRLVYDLIKVYMLEKDTSTTSSTEGGGGQVQQEGERDLFRLPSIEYSISKLLSPLQIHSLPTQTLPPPAPYSSSSSTSSSSENEKKPTCLESIHSLQSSSTFFQFYQDFLHLYDSISLGDKNFSLLLLPTLSMEFELDYRKLVWCDDQYQHLLKTLNKIIKVEDVISTEEEESKVTGSYLYPVEKDETLLFKGYLNGLNLFQHDQEEEEDEDTGFFKFLAIHHLSQTIFSSTTLSEKDRALKSRLVKSLLRGGGRKERLIRSIVRYRQTSQNGDRLRSLKEAIEAIEEEELMKRLSLIKELVGGGDHEGIDLVQTEKIVRVSCCSLP